MSVRVLCSGDIHIGRRSSKVQGTFRSADAWRDIVDTAINQQVDLVALSGDLIDKESKSYEALGPMQHGLARLAEAGIETVAVAGNHDHDVLVRLTSITGTDRFHLLGQGGTWERFTLTRSGQPLLHVDGWSFSSEHIRQFPLQSYVPQRDDGVPVMGLVHGDVGVYNSSYAPILEQELWATPFRFTLLGHIHVTNTFHGPEDRKALYPGSPYALDPGEKGLHGIWMADIEPSGSVSLNQIPISPVHYAATEVDLQGITDEPGFQRQLSFALQELGERASGLYGSASLKVVSARLTCIGECPAHMMVDTWIQQARTSMATYPVGSISIELDTLTSSVRPPIDLHQRAEGSDPVAEAAKIILALDEVSPAPPYSTLIADTLDRMQKVYEHPGYAWLKTPDIGRSDAPDESGARAFIRSRAWELLSLLVAQESTK